jgi:hypothetical protein
MKTVLFCASRIVGGVCFEFLQAPEFFVVNRGGGGQSRIEKHFSSSNLCFIVSIVLQKNSSTTDAM